MRRERIRRWMTGGILALIVPLAGHVVDAEADVSILAPDELDLVRTPTDLETPFVLAVLNGGTSPTAITLNLQGLADDDGSPVPRSELRVMVGRHRLPRTVRGVKAGGLARFNLHFEGAAPPSGTYTGILFAYAKDGSSTHIPMRLVMMRTTTGSSASPALDPRSISTLTQSWSVTLFSPLHIAWGKPPTIPLVDAYAGQPDASTVVGQLANTHQGLANVTRNLNDLTVDGIDESGDFKGTIDLLPGQAGGDSTLDIQNKDLWLVPVAILALGVLLSMVITRYVKASRVKKRLGVELTKLEEKTTALQDAATPHPPLPPDPGAPTSVYMIYAPATPTGGLLGAATSEARKSLDEADSEAERTRWAFGGLEFGRIAGYVDSLKALYTAANAVDAHFRALYTFYNRYHLPGVPFESLPVVEHVNAALAGRLISTRAELTTLQDALKDAGTFLDAFKEMFEETVRLEHAADVDRLKARAIYLQKELLSPDFDSSDLIPPVREDIVRLGLEIAASKIDIEPSVHLGLVEIIERSAVGEGEDVLADLRATPGLVFGFSDLERFIPRAGDVAAGLPDLPAALSRVTPQRPPKPEPSSTQLLRLRRSDRLFNIGSFVIIVVSGIALVYLTSQTFGSWKDYATIFLWGLGLDVGIKLVRQFTPGFVGRLAGI